MLLILEHPKLRSYLNAGTSASTSKASIDMRRMMAMDPKNMALGLLSGGVMTSAITGGGGAVVNVMFGGVVVMFGVAAVGSSPAEI